MKKRLFIVTSSSLKFRELSQGLEEFFECEQRGWNEPEIQGEPEEILRHKMDRAYEILHEPVIVDDVTVHFEALNGFPGPYMKDFFKVMTPLEMGTKFAGTRIKAVCRLGLRLDEDDFLIAKGEFNGTVVAPKDNNHQNRWFELFVQLDGMDRPMIEYSLEEKNTFSHRGMAIKNLIEMLRK